MSICRIASNIVKNVNNLHKLKTKNPRNSKLIIEKITKQNLSYILITRTIQQIKI